MVQYSQNQTNRGLEGLGRDVGAVDNEEYTCFYCEPVNAFAHTIINDKEYFHFPYLERCIENELKKVPAVANGWLQQIMNILKKYEQKYGNEMLLTIPKIVFYIHKMPFLEIVNVHNSLRPKKHKIQYKIYYFPMPRSTNKPRHVNLLSKN